MLSSTFPEFLTALAEGRITVAHCRRLAEATRLVSDERALQVIGRTALRSACRMTPGRFADRLDALVAEHDPDAATRRQRTIDISRDCTVQRMRDGMGRLVYVDSWVKVQAVGDRIRAAGRATQKARRGGALDASGTSPSTAGTTTTSSPNLSPSARRWPRPSQTGDARDDELVVPSAAARAVRRDEAPCPTDASEGGGTDAGLEWATDAGSCRADAMLALTLGSDTVDGVVLDPDQVVRVDVEVVIDLETLRGEADHVALLDGAPVPAEVGRDWARQARTFRRMVTDPVTGHLLDKGRAYLADDVRDFVLHRDGGCRIPTCGVRHRDRLQVDHAEPYPRGATSAANLGALDVTHHQLKTAGHLDLLESAADGSAVLTTAWGQRIVIPPRPYLREPDPDDLAPPEPAPHPRRPAPPPLPDDPPL